uniref:ABC transporter domain-containing protein n=1 Tax=Davidia involucrata TaxID=16924 RepID=A0A5B7AZN9_DAVIN
MENRASFWTQADALLRKNLTYQKRNLRANIRILAFPVFLFLLLSIGKYVEFKLTRKRQTSEAACRLSLDMDELDSNDCPIRRPVEWPPLLQIPAPEYRAVTTDFIPFTDLPDKSCKITENCPATILLTGNNQSLGQSLAKNMLGSSFTPNSSDFLRSFANGYSGSDKFLNSTLFLDPGVYYSNRHAYSLYYLQSKCTQNSTFLAEFELETYRIYGAVSCVQGLSLWRNTSSEINDELRKGYSGGNSEGKINEIIAAYDFLNSNGNNFNVSIWFNSTHKDMAEGRVDPTLLRVPRSVNLASNAYLQLLFGPAMKMQFEFNKEMPKQRSGNQQSGVDMTSEIAEFLFIWVVLQLFPVMLTYLVYEKQQNLRIMMKMHGLGDGPYWIISYAYFLMISFIYMLLFVVFGSISGYKFFTMNDYRIQFLFYFTYINLQISLAFLAAAFFSNVKTASVTAFVMVFATGLSGPIYFRSNLENPSFSRSWITFLELYPGFSLQRGLYEFSDYSSTGISAGSDGMRWANLSDSANGVREVLFIMLVEWFVVLFIAFYIDQVASSGSGVRRSPLFFFQNFQKKPLSSFQKPSFQRQGSNAFVQMEKADVTQERERVEQLLVEPSTSYAIVSHDLRKVYPGIDGNPDKVAVRGMSLALPRGECFGLLGPNGAGKTSFIKMMIGLMKPSSGTAYVQGLDIRTNMDGIYTSMGVCPQHDLLWETLTGREHLLFYGRLKNLKGAALTQAVEKSLKDVGLFNGGVADKQAGKYSGGMKRRLSVAISLIGDPKVVYMDEPSTGLDPASRHGLWNVVMRAKKDRAIILTTHSMEEAEYLCDRLGIFVDGSLQCIGDSNELKARYGGSYVFTMTTPSQHDEEVENLVRRLSPSANKTYHISGTQKFELPKHEVRIADVFQAVENAKSRFNVHAWGLVDTTLEDVFIKVAREAQAFNVLS